MVNAKYITVEKNKNKRKFEAFSSIKNHRLETFLFRLYNYFSHFLRLNPTLDRSTTDL